MPDIQPKCWQLFKKAEKYECGEQKVVETNPEITSMKKLVNKTIGIVLITVFYKFKMLEERLDISRYREIIKNCISGISNDDKYSWDEKYTAWELWKLDIEE